MSIIIVAASFHKDIAEEMIEAATLELEGRGKKVGVKKVAGCYEAPLVVERVMADKDTEAVVVLGYIEKGQTMHGEVMGHVVHKALIDLQLKHSKPVGMGIIGPGATKEQAQARAKDYAAKAAKAALENLAIIKDEV
ncbi:MAG: 6,7-dimethyl-8-ribityllumazine synthase [Parcubacteria group bacterium Gr01-1014_30]|nr:MAG: 6,7-dimethyl-8-ribityllumazine synthase [Parcubacteria group bacterium Gr01-1014_30]